MDCSCCRVERVVVQNMILPLIALSEKRTLLQFSLELLKKYSLGTLNNSLTESLMLFLAPFVQSLMLSAQEEEEEPEEKGNSP